MTDRPGDWGVTNAGACRVRAAFSSNVAAARTRSWQARPVPELPEVESLAAYLRATATGLRVARVELAAISALKTFDPPVTDLVADGPGIMRLDPLRLRMSSVLTTQSL